MLPSLAEFTMSLLLGIVECILGLGKRKLQGSTFHFFCHQVRGPRFPDTGLYNCSSSPIFNNCMATTSVWFGRLHQELAGTGGTLLPVCLPGACPHMYLWHTICQVWCWIGKDLATVTWMCSFCGISNLYLLSKAPSHWQIWWCVALNFKALQRVKDNIDVTENAWGKIRQNICSWQLCDC